MDPEKKSLNFIFPTKYVIPKSLKFSHWPSKGVIYHSYHSIYNWLFRAHLVEVKQIWTKHSRWWPSRDLNNSTILGSHLCNIWVRVTWTHRQVFNPVMHWYWWSKSCFFFNSCMLNHFFNQLPPKITFLQILVKFRHVFVETTFPRFKHHLSPQAGPEMSFLPRTSVRPAVGRLVDS